MLLKDKVAVITGGAGLNGLGFATAREMAAHGARVVILDLAAAEPAKAAALLGEQHMGLVASVHAEVTAAALLAASNQPPSLYFMDCSWRAMISLNAMVFCVSLPTDFFCWRILVMASVICGL